MKLSSTLLGTAAAVTLLVASAARPVSAERGPRPSDCAVHGTCCFVAKPAAAQWTPVVIDIDLDRLTVGGTGLERFQVRRALRRQTAAVDACFGRDDQVDVVFVISPAGGVVRPTASSSDPELAACVARALARVAFPVADDGAPTDVSMVVQGRRR